MHTARRLSVVMLAAGLSLASVALPPAHAADGRIDVTADGSAIMLVADGSLAAFSDYEELAVVPNTQNAFIDITVLDESVDSGVGRPLLYSSTPRCLPLGQLTNHLQCLGLKDGQVRVDFSAVTVPTTTAVYTGYGSISLAFKGGSGADYVQGGVADDYILGGGGNDLIFGGGGDDFLSGGPQDDKIEGEAGRDDMRGDSGSNSLDAADGIADTRVDCGGAPEFLDFDKGLDTPVNCGNDPVPPPPGPVEPVEPPAQGEGNATIDGQPAPVTVQPAAGDATGVAVTTPGGPRLIAGLAWLNGTPTIDQVLNRETIPLFANALWARVQVFITFFFQQLLPPRGAANAPSARVAAPTTVLVADAQGVAEGSVPVPPGPAGVYTMQVNTVTAAGVAATINVAVVKDSDGPPPQSSITIASAKRGKGAKATTITITGTTTGLVGAAVTPRYRVQGAKKWTLGKPVTVSANGAFVATVTTPKKVSITVVAGAVMSKPVKVSAAAR